MTAVRLALLTPYLAGYRMPLFARLAREHDLELLCYGGGERYVPSWLADLDAQIAASPLPARRIDGPRAAFAAGRHADAVIAPFAGGAVLPAAYAGARAQRARFLLWASVWVAPRSPAHLLARPATNHIYRRADAVIAYGEHVRRFVARMRGRDDDVFVAPQAVEPELFARPAPPEEVVAFRARHGLGTGPLVLYAGRLAPAKGIDVLARAWPRVRGSATLVVAGDGPLAGDLAALADVRLLGPLPRAALPAAYAAAVCALLPSVPTPRFVEPWGLVCNEAMHQARPVIATPAVGAVAGGLVRHDETGLVVPPGDAPALAAAIDRLLRDAGERLRLGAAARQAVAAYTPDAMAAAFERALASATRPSPTGPPVAR